MSCSTCNKMKGLSASARPAPLATAKAAAAPAGVEVTKGLPYLLAPGTKTIGTGRYKSLPVRSCVIPSMRSPLNGWGVDLVLKGQHHHVTGKGPVQVFTSVKKLLDLNEIPSTDVDLWLNLNMIWVKRAILRYQKITITDLMQVAIPNPRYNEEEL